VALGFLLFAATFFTLSRSKLVSYLVPALPPLAWLAAGAWQPGRSARSAGVILLALYAALAVASEWARGFSSTPTGLALALDPATLRSLAIAFAACALLALASVSSRRQSLALAAALAFTPTVLAVGHPLLVAYASSNSGAPLARAIGPVAAGTVRYEGCYSPGTDFLLGQRGTLITGTGVETTSNYQLRYRATLVSRGQWTPRAEVSPGDQEQVVVRAAGMPAPTKPGWRQIFHDVRFVAWRITNGP
jgi:4-amino-4-deoxy-L-arabinose transferase-like glycosyltransferase